MKLLTTVTLTALLVAFLAAPCPAVLEGFDPFGTGAGYPEDSSGRSGPKPSLRAHRIAAGPIEIDGRLDEDDWIEADAGTGFTQFQPNRHGEPCEETVIKFIYDADAFYVGVACYHLNGSELTTCLSRRDNIMNSDRIRVYIERLLRQQLKAVIVHRQRERDRRLATDAPCHQRRHALVHEPAVVEARLSVRTRRGV